MASYIPAFVLDKNDNVFLNYGTLTTIGSIMEVPTPSNGAYLDGDVWAVPINFGTYSGFKFLPYNRLNPSENVAPNPMSVACTKISCTNSYDWFIVLGTSAQYVTAADGGAALPQAWPQVSHSIPLLPVCQTLSYTNPSGQYIYETALPSFDLDPTTVQALFIYGLYNGFNLPASTPNGYTTTAALLVFLNTATVNTGTATAPVYTGGWGIVGTWTLTADGITLTATQSAGTGTDVVCAAIIPILPSAS